MLNKVKPEELNDIWSTLDDYQQNGVIHALKGGRTIVDLPVGAGKTLIGLCAALKAANKKILIMGSKSSLGTWRKELLKWVPSFVEGESFVVVEGTSAKRKKLWSQNVQVYICTFNSVVSDNPHIPFDFVVVDECHKIRNRKAKTHIALKPLFKRVGRVIMLTGTLKSRGPQDAWGLLNLCDSKTFSSYWRFVETFCIIEEDFWGAKNYIGVKNEDYYARLITPYVYRMTDEELSHKLPPIRRQAFPVTLDPKLLAIYKDLEQNLSTTLESGKIITISTTIAQSMKLRQFLTCPKILSPDLGYGKGIEAVLDKIEDSDGELDHCVIYTPFTSAMDHFEQYIRERTKRTDIFQLRGGTDSKTVAARVKEFKEKKGIMLCSIRFSQSFELETSNVGFFIGFEWDPNENIQAEGRQRRKISKGPVNMFYCIHEDTVEEHMNVFVQSKVDKVRQISKHVPRYLDEIVANWRTAMGPINSS